MSADKVDGRGSEGGREEQLFVSGRTAVPTTAEEQSTGDIF
jgi:hypothetical protein